MGWWKADPVPDPQPSNNTQPAPSSIPISPHPSIPSSDDSSCPVDPKTRSIWLQQAQKQAQPQQNPSSAAVLPPSHPTIPTASSSAAEECPVDPKTRSIWLEQAKKQSQFKSQSQSQSQITTPPTTVQPTSPTTATAKSAFVQAPSENCSSDRIDQSLPTPSTKPTQNNTTQYRNFRPLSEDREISSIPRAFPFSSTPILQSQPQSAPPKSNPTPSNAETETGHDTKSGNWIYPSESQFFSAVMRKQTASSPEDLASSISHIIPIHNAVNERAWTMIQSWEANTSSSCGGPKLSRFEGKGAGAKTPRALFKSWILGYVEPFDRHDWVVQRCDGQEVEYVIDFYPGRGNSNGAAGLVGSGGGNKAGEGLNFYLDVRPKLNSVEGVRMRVERFWGWR